MSVICQNFVQNAWKKDLCSNCFKSVGDHDFSESVTKNEIQTPNQNGNIRYVSQAANTLPSHTNPTPHTTWKTLISEKNSKNTQPFKLENGFQGRLLTINKASHGIERKFIKNTNLTRNGHLTKSSSNDDLLRTTNGHSLKTKNDVSHLKTNGQSVNGYSVQNGNGCLQTDDMQVNTEARLNESVPKSPSPVNGKISGVQNSGYEQDKKLQLKLVKSRSEDSLSSPLHSILKKTISSPTNSNQLRRNSNVGFKDEEPLVIGYGGRDFSPEELEWDMNVSDIDTENGSDSLDETEDDRAFSKITKENTEFNSDNTNLLQHNQAPSESKEKRLEKNEENKYPPNPSQAKLKKNKGTNSPENSMNGFKSAKVPEQGVTGKAKTVENDGRQLNNQMDVEEKERNRNESNSRNSPIQLEIKDSEICNHAIKDKNDSTNVTIESDKASHVVSSGEVTVVEAAKTEESRRAQGKNSTELVNEALPSSRVIPSQNIINDDTDNGTQDNSEMFSDGEEQVRKDESTLPDETNEWQNGSGLAGQILQAINTSLTNRHKMKEEQTAEPHNTEQSSEIKPGTENLEIAEVKTNHILSSDKNTVNSIKDVPAENVESSDDETIVSGLSVEPRTSFLHGISSNNKPTKPSAIYGPASDLFVSRSNSSSSSSSDEFGKSEVSHSINVIVNGETNGQQQRLNGNIIDNENETDSVQQNYISDHESSSTNTCKPKPKIPAKPFNSIARSPQKQFVPEYTKSNSLDSTLVSDQKISISNGTQDSYYSVANATTYSDDPKSISLVDHYAESNIYHEVGNTEVKLEESDSNEKAVPRESKLAALAMELEQVRHCNGNTKRQAPAPPKIPEPPLEDPPNCMGRTSPLTTDAPHGFATFRGEAMAFSSSSSTASTSSQDTETGYASWNIHGDIDDNRKHSKSKSSFLLTQYSKCKMLAMGYTDDSSKARKKFSLKKLLKIRKDSEAPPSFDPNCPNPKAWKYSDHFERPRAKLEIIHPMDLENKSVTINPGFDSLHSGSMLSFTASADDLSLRNSVSSDYGSFYSDTMSPPQDLKSEVNYECIPQRHSLALEEQEDSSERNVTCNSNSPTPSRTSLVSQASTLTSGSSKNGGASPHRPPKPPPPPRAHSLLPVNKALNADGTFKFPVLNCHSTANIDSPTTPTKPQAPKRQAKSVPPRTDFGIYDNTSSDPVHVEAEVSSEDKLLKNNRISIDENTYGTILDVRVNSLEKHCSETQEDETLSRLSPTESQKDSNKRETNFHETKPEYQSINVTVKTISEPVEKVSNNTIARNKHSPVTKAPARPPPIYMKSQISGIVKNPNPWKTLEDSYLFITASNRELLIKLVNQALKKRKNYVLKLQKVEFQWSDFEIDVDQPSSVFAFGEKIAYHATMPEYPEYSITLVVTVQQQHNRMNESSDLKFPVFGQFVDYIPKELLDNSNDAELESMQATILVLDRSNISTIECFTESLPSSLTEENEKELCFIILQLIHSLKSLQAHGIESIDSSFQNLILAKSKHDKHNTLVFLSDNCYDENDYLSDSCKISLCQYALMLLFQLLGIQSAEEFFLPPAGKFSSETSKKVFETAVSLLSEEKAVSLSQTKTLFECFLWGATKILDKLDASDDVDAVLHRWLDIKRANYIKSIFDDENVCDINMQSEYFSQFLIRTSVRSIKEVISYL